MERIQDMTSILLERGKRKENHFKAAFAQVVHFYHLVYIFILGGFGVAGKGNRFISEKIWTVRNIQGYQSLPVAYVTKQVNQSYYAFFLSGIIRKAIEN